MQIGEVPLKMDILDTGYNHTTIMQEIIIFYQIKVLFTILTTFSLTIINKQPTLWSALLNRIEYISYQSIIITGQSSSESIGKQQYLALRQRRIMLQDKEDKPERELTFTQKQVIASYFQVRFAGNDFHSGVWIRRGEEGKASGSVLTKAQESKHRKEQLSPQEEGSIVTALDILST